jgi:hypothetical protein
LLWPQTYETPAKCFGRVPMINRSITLLPKYITKNNQKIVY